MTVKSIEINYIVEFIINSVTGAGKKGCVVGVSGGVDSAVVATLCKRAFPNTTHLVAMPEAFTAIDAPEYENRPSTIRAEELALCLATDLIYDPVLFNASKMSGHTDLAQGNYCARMRMAKLYYHAERTQSLVVGTDNATEAYLGFYTKYGDGGVDINPLGEFLKNEVYELARLLYVPTAIIKAVPSAELYEGQTDEDEIGYSYEYLDAAIRMLRGYPKGEETNKFVYDEDKLMGAIKKVSDMYKKSAHKRQTPPVLNRSSHI